MKWSNKRVLVTGGAGFIGSELVKALIKRNADIVIVDNFSTGCKEALNNIGCTVIDCNVQDLECIERLKQLEPFDIVFHLAAPSSDVLFREKPVECIQATIIGFINILSLAKSWEVKKFVYASSSSVYGKTPPPQSERSPTQPTNLYGVSKLICEKIVKKENINSIGLRIFAGYGPGEIRKGRIASVVTLFLKSLLQGKPPIIYGDGSQRRDFIYIEDIINAFIKAVERDVKGIVNVGTGRSYSFIELLNLLKDKLSLPRNINPIFVPKPPGYFNHTKADITLMLRELEITPMDLDKGIDKYLEHLNYSKYLRSLLVLH